jgi:Regulator of chromosome condensation (RCC1) repeat
MRLSLSRSYIHSSCNPLTTLMCARVSTSLNTCFTHLLVLLLLLPLLSPVLSFSLSSPQVSLGRKVKPIRISAGQTHFLCVSERSSGDRLLYSWGLGSYGQLGLDDCLHASQPTRVNLTIDRHAVKDVSEVYCGLNHSVIMSGMPLSLSLSFILPLFCTLPLFRS